MNLDTIRSEKWNRHGTQDRVAPQHFVGHVHWQEQTAVRSLDAGRIARPHLQPAERDTHAHFKRQWLWSVSRAIREDHRVQQPTVVSRGWWHFVGHSDCGRPASDPTFSWSWGWRKGPSGEADVNAFKCLLSRREARIQSFPTQVPGLLDSDGLQLRPAGKKDATEYNQRILTCPSVSYNLIWNKRVILGDGYQFLCLETTSSAPAFWKLWGSLTHWHVSLTAVGSHLQPQIISNCQAIFNFYELWADIYYSSANIYIFF